MLAALGSTMTGAGKFDWTGLLDWHTAKPALDLLLAIDRELDDRQRTVALDLATMVTPRTARFYAAVAVLTDTRLRYQDRKCGTGSDPGCGRTP